MLFCKTIIENVLKALYQPFGFAIIMTILFSGLYMLAKEKGWKTIFQEWCKLIKSSSDFRTIICLAFYTSMILFKTLLYRNIWLNPLSNVIGVWGLYNANGELTTETIENLALFIPFTVLALWCFREKLFAEGTKLLRIIWQSVKIVFLFSLTIEFLQLFLRLGTFQLSDLFYNTLGGLVGGLIYWCGYKIKKRQINCATKNYHYEERSSGENETKDSLG